MSWLRVLVPYLFPLGGLALLCAVSATGSAVLSAFVEERMLLQEARLTQEFVENIVHVEKAEGYFSGNPAEGSDIQGAFEHISKLPDILHASMYSADGRLVWSTTPEFLARAASDDPDLVAALEGNLVARASGRYKRGHAYISPRFQWFVTIYTPVRHASSDAVIGVVELYRAPQPLLTDIRKAQDIIWMTSLLGDVVLLLAFLWLLRHARGLLDDQRNREAREYLGQSEARADARV